MNGCFVRGGVTMRGVSSRAFATVDSFRVRFASASSKQASPPPLQRARAQSECKGCSVAEPKSAYVHLPFCKRRCYYCDFPIQVLGEKQSDAADSAVTRYIQLLCDEIRRTPREGERALETVFFGGGTPSLVPPRDLESVIETLRDRFGFDEALEMSLSLGVNRVSVGVQSFDDATLKRCGRSHSAEEVRTALEDVRAARIPSWSLDLISGLPHLSLESWKDTLIAAIESDPDHVSIYDLQIEPSTAFGKWYVPEVAPLPSHELSAEMYRVASRMLGEAGYEHYEISNYAKKGHRCRHNMAYWKNAPFYGFGLGATSHLRGKRIARPRRMKAYAEWVRNHYSLELKGAHDDLDDDGDDDPVLDTIMLALRLRDGIHLESFEKKHGVDVANRLKQSVESYCDRGLAECTDEDGTRLDWKGDWTRIVRLRLSDPDGFLISNSILTSIFNTFQNTP